MEISKQLLTQITITGVKALDPVELILDDVRHNAGRITVACAGQAWTAYFSSHGYDNVEEFVAMCPAEYLVDKLSSGPVRANRNDIAYLGRVVAAIKEACKVSIEGALA